VRKTTGTEDQASVERSGSPQTPHPRTTHARTGGIKSPISYFKGESPKAVEVKPVGDAVSVSVGSKSVRFDAQGRFSLQEHGQN
jgi:hypothetical protein